jgi:hypothetical protein
MNDTDITTLRFIEASAIFEPEITGLDCLWLVETEPPFTWGDADRTLVTVERLLNHLEARYKEERNPDIVGAIKRLRKLYKASPALYVDLEN